MASLYRQTNHTIVYPRKNHIHSHRPLHLSCMLANTLVRNLALLCQWPLLLDQSHPCFKSRYPDGARYLTCYLGRLDDPTRSGCWVHEAQFMPWWKNPRRSRKRIGAHILFWSSCRITLVRRIWSSKYITIHKHGSDCGSTYDGRVRSHHVGWNA